jgi:hypothetical protein
VRVEWVEWYGPPGPFGHGVEFHAGEPQGRETLVGFLPGYDWVHGRPKTVQVQVRQPDDQYSAEMIRSLREAVETALRNRSLRHGLMPGSQFFAWFNA